MRTLMAFGIVFGIVLLMFIVAVLLACLKVASDADDAMEREERNVVD